MLLRCISRHSATFSPLILILLWNVVSQEKMLRNNAVYESSVRRHDLGYESPNPADTQHKYHTNAKVSSQHLHRSFFFFLTFCSILWYFVIFLQLLVLNFYFQHGFYSIRQPRVPHGQTVESWRGVLVLVHLWRPWEVFELEEVI